VVGLGEWETLCFAKASQPINAEETSAEETRQWWPAKALRLIHATRMPRLEHAHVTASVTGLVTTD
jgi:hypothetical protein